ncbi:MAG: sigma-70 family RNA polymerase sigma factor [Rhodothermaceae bacterium]|jgi:RNA polymerase sigma factor (sigma-70 family)|nr:sigma-70 family RNA polymerase sigma factor [Rhodothermaceae bacterium]
MKNVNAQPLSQMTDEDLMEMFQGGHEKAFDIIVERYQNRIHNFIFRYTQNHMDCEDLVQETFLRVFRCRNSYERIAKFSTWLYTIAGNLVKSQYKKNKRMQMVSITGHDEHDQEYEIDVVDTREKPDCEVDNRLLVNYIEKALDRIPLEFKELIILRDIQNLTYEEIMQITDLPMGTVKSRINRGRVRLQGMINSFTNAETIFAA